MSLLPSSVRAAVGDRIARVAAVALLSTGIACVPAAPARVAPTPVDPGAAAAARLEAVRSDSAALLQFLRDMPKGGDLHSHLSGAVYAESYARWAAEDGLCLVRATATLVPPPCDGDTTQVAARRLLEDPALHAAVIDAWSMRNWRPEATSGHAQFFGSFRKFGLVASRRTGDMLAEVTARAAAQRIGYLELMVNTDGGSAGRLGRQLQWSDDWPSLVRRLDSLGLGDSLRLAVAALDRAEARYRAVLRCGTPAADAGCAVVVRYLYQVNREREPAEMFAQLLAGFRLAQLDSRIVGFNLVAPEDGPVAMRDFALHMAIIDHLHQRHPDVPITLHAGELTDALVGSPAETPRSHIRASIRQGHARRIGHGVDVLREPDPEALLREMATRRVLVEVALTSNRVILGVQGARHPLRSYLRHGVPVAFVTDDEGVSRSDLTHELLAAVQDQGLEYAELRAAVRNSLEHAFLDGRSLWHDAPRAIPVADCAAERGGLQGARCAAYVRAEPKARLQRQLELELAAFERAVAAPAARP